MDASIYFRLTDRIEIAQSLRELSTLESEIDRAQPHPMERRALAKRIRSREQQLRGALPKGIDASRFVAVDAGRSIDAFLV